MIGAKSGPPHPCHWQIRRQYILALTLMISLLLAVIVNLRLQSDVIYTHFFYIPIILTVVWYGLRPSLYLALFLGWVHIGMNYWSCGVLLSSALWRAAFFLLLALLVHVLYRRENESRQRAFKLYQERIIEPGLRLDITGEIGKVLAHKVRNPMTSVRGFVQLMQTDEQYRCRTELYQLMLDELDEADNVLAQIVLISRDFMTMRESCRLDDLVHEVVASLQTAYPHITFAHHAVQPDLPDLHLDRRQIKVLVANLLKNAVESMPKGGIVQIKTRADRKAVSLVIEDKGHGIALNESHRLGIPFHTAKPDAAGLGLAACYRIAERHRAKIHLESRASGTLAQVDFPLVSSGQSPPPPPRKPLFPRMQNCRKGLEVNPGEWEGSYGMVEHRSFSVYPAAALHRYRKSAWCVYASLGRRRSFHADDR